ncbi:hypothetical protein D0867_06840 [Hortaea werneckii]|uniref:FK506-binding protein n=1 Tax=Hortaea werneckii TaxID=91943 RepID=A0A3M6ZJD1_HORWE|nr:hypothetical protein D0867_06840 [Hortaea werneckii]RMY30825.1 hypothetical protein D0866_07726 [Hortaea werneckii]
MLMEEGMDVDEDDSKPNGVAKSAKAKGKMPASDEEDDEDDEDDDDMSDEGEVEEFVICTLDPQKNYQQPLDITVGDDERVWFKVSGTHSIFLTGNYVELPGSRDGEDDDEDDYDSEDDYDLEPDEDEIDEEDELDDMGGPRITEVEDEEEAPKLVEASKQADKKNNKRAAAEDEPETLDEMITKESGPNGEQKLSKKQLKKQKKNDGSAVTVEKTEEKPADAPSSAKSDKKVSFAKELEQGPTPNKDEKAKGALGVKVVQGVTIDDKKLGTGPAAKSGDRVAMRYIGKLQKDNKVFDSNKKGKPFSFKLGAGQVIKGWEIGIQGLAVGGERRITIPANLAYGKQNMGDIPPNSTLIFDVKLLEVNKGK